MPTHKKGHDKDKYYHLAKDQGFRSRAAFKLIQINKRFDFLSKARVCVDLCAAPGGWCQVAAKCMPAGSIVLGVDLLPIKAIRNVKTIVADITTAECRKMVVQELQGWKADVVLCDGAPNIGASYDKDAYVQNELVIAALKTATDHLVEGGTFCTKVYRSADYNAIVWVLQQLFEDVQTIKPNSSRSQSSEIFIVCLKYTAPKYIDPKLLDPNHVFKEVADPGTKKIDVMHKKYDKHNLRHRTGYDDEMGMTLRVKGSVTEFIQCKEPIRMLTDVNEIHFTEADEVYKNHPKTKPEIITALSDLKVLGKVDFKKILKWRQLMIDTENLQKEETGELSEVQLKQKERYESRHAPVTEDKIDAELMNLSASVAQQERKEKKKSKREQAKELRRKALGMTNNAFEVDGDQELFNLAEQTTLQQLHELGDVDLNEREEPSEAESEDEKETEEQRQKLQQANEDLEAQLEGDYERFLAGRRKKKTANDDDMNEEGRTVSSKRHKKAQQSEALIRQLNNEDQVSGELEAYVSLLSKGSQKTKTDDKKNKSEKEGKNGKRQQQQQREESSEEDSDEEEEQRDSDEYSDDEDEPAAKRSMVTRDGPSKAAKTDKWFAHPIFKTGLISDATTRTVDFDASGKQKSKKKQQQDSEDEEGDMDIGMPKSDREKRREARKKDAERNERRQNKRQARNNADAEEGEGEQRFNEFEVVKNIPDPEDDADKPHRAKNTENTAAMMQYRDLIKRGLGNVGADSGTAANGKSKKQKTTSEQEADRVREEAEGFEVVKATNEKFSELFPNRDERSYDSSEEEYDNHDRLTTLALGTMMLRQSRKKAFVDASYNRYSWNDSKDLPTWFLDDEIRHNKPQLPIPSALLEQIKSRYQSTGTKEIKKVAEARMRKRKRAASKLKAAKKQASVMAENSEMSEKQKIKAISKAMRTSKIDKPGKVYVVAKKTKQGSVGNSSGGKGKLKFVDKRMKKDAKAMKRATQGFKKKRKH